MSIFAATAIILAAAQGSDAGAAQAADFAAGAEACIAALQPGSVDAAALRRAGWTPVRSGNTPLGRVQVFGRDGNGVHLFVSGMGHCVVDGFATAADQFDLIRNAIRDQLAARFGADFRLGEGSDRGTSRGQGFSVGERIAIMSSENRPQGLSVRITSMQLPAR